MTAPWLDPDDPDVTTADVIGGTCDDCEGSGNCGECGGCGTTVGRITHEVHHCRECKGTSKCASCDGLGYLT